MSLAIYVTLRVPFVLFQSSSEFSVTSSKAPPVRAGQLSRVTMSPEEAKFVVNKCFVSLQKRQESPLSSAITQHKLQLVSLSNHIAANMLKRILRFNPNRVIILGISSVNGSFLTQSFNASFMWKAFSSKN